MLSAENRLRRSAEFRRVLNSGRRRGAPTVVVYAATPSDRGDGVRVGFVVSKSVGGAVVRNRVRRRLRHAVRPELGPLSVAGALDVVVRATPRATDATFEELRGDLLECLAGLGQVAA